MKKYFYLIFCLLIILNCAISEKEISKELTTISVKETDTTPANSVKSPEEEAKEAVAKTIKKRAPDQNRDKNYDKWIGEYEVNFVEAQGEGPYNVFVEISIKDQELVHFTTYSKEFNSAKKEYLLAMYGTIRIVNKNNTAIEYLPAVLFEGDRMDWEDGFTLYEENGKFFVKSDLFVPEDFPNGKIPIIKTKK